MADGPKHVSIVYRLDFDRSLLLIYRHQELEAKGICVSGDVSLGSQPLSYGREPSNKLCVQKLCANSIKPGILEVIDFNTRGSDRIL